MNKLLLCVSICFLVSCYSENEEDLYPMPDPIPAEKEISFSTDIKPILINHCTSCHNGGSFAPGNWNNYSELKTRVDNGKFNTKVLDPATLDMPKGNPSSLPANDRELLRKWVEQGAKDN